MGTAIETAVTINGIKYIPESEISTYQSSGEIKIVVLQRGWVMVGYFKKDGSDCKLEKAATIRTWGTSKGLGELALEGPKASTKLDKCNGLVEFDYLTVVCTITCKESVWANVL